MNLPTRTFIRYQRPLRTKQMAVQIIVTFAVAAGGLYFAWAGFEPHKAPREPKFSPIVGLIVGSVALVIACGNSWSFLLGRIHTVQITDQGVFYDGKHWPWKLVIAIETRPNAAGAGGLYIAVDQGIVGIPLALPIELEDDEAVAAAHDLREFLADANFPIPWS